MSKPHRLSDTGRLILNGNDQYVADVADATPEERRLMLLGLNASEALVEACNGLLQALELMNALNHPELAVDVAKARAALAKARGEVAS